MANSIDEKDRSILSVLQDHADYTTREIAKLTLLPVTTVHHRIKNLRRREIIKKYTVELDSVAMNNSFTAYVLISANLAQLKERKKTQHDLAREIRSLPFVERVDIVSGGTDLVAIVRVKDVQEYDRVLLGKLQLIAGIDKTQSLIVLHSA